MATITYSPVQKMDIINLDETLLKQMKYTQLLKLSAKANIRKRWAKKEDLIKSLLDVKQKMLEAEEVRDNNINEEIEEDWVDGGAMFKDIKPLSPDRPSSARSTFTKRSSTGRSSSNRRSTFTVEKLDDCRGTYHLTNVINDILPDSANYNRRDTFSIPKKPVVKSTDVKPTTDKAPSKVKMLTVPYSRPAGRLSTNKPTPVKQSPLKLSNKSIAIKKSKAMMSPLKTSRINIHRNQQVIASQQTNLAKPVQKVQPLPSNVPRNSAALRPSLPRRKSKSDDPTARRISATATSVQAFRSPQLCPKKAVSTAKKPVVPLSNVTQNVQKPVTRKKLPDFASIHQRQFEKMDSLDEYLNKKSDRVKKLFGTPSVSRPIDRILKPQNSQISQIPLIATQKSTKSIATDVKSVKSSLQDAKKMLSRNPAIRTQTDVKDKNRSHIHGFRSNKRFELQMKFRNL